MNDRQEPGDSADLPSDRNLLLHTRALRALPAHTAVLDATGRIVLVNDAWLAFTADNQGSNDRCLSVGADYLDVCRRAANTEPSAGQALHGIESVLTGRVPRFAMEYPCHSPTEQRWFLMTVVPLSIGQRNGAVVSHTNITAQKRAEAALAASESRFRAMFDTAGAGIAEVAPDGTWLRANKQMLRVLNLSADALPATNYHDLTHPDDRDLTQAQLEVMRIGGGEAFSTEKRLRRGDGDYIWVASTESCIRAADGAIDYLIVVITDISDRKVSEARQQTLLRELAHRGKNLLAVVQSIVQRSLTGDRTLAEANDILDGRLQALAQTYSVLTHEAFDGAMLDEILRQELEQIGDQVVMRGPPVRLNVKAAQTFGLVVHELATNAMKYGSLSVPGGRLLVEWDVAGQPDQRVLTFAWTEHDGPPVVAPQRSGFGTTLVTSVAGSDFGCRPALAFPPTGLTYRFAAPLARIGSVMTDTPLRRRLHSDIVCSLYDCWARQRDATGGLPPLAGIDWSLFGATGFLTIAAIGEGDEIRFPQVGHALIRELGRPLNAQDLTGLDEQSLRGMYRTCAERGEPVHQYLQFDFGDGNPLTFEQLLVPFGMAPDGPVSHVASVAIIQGQTRPD